MKNKQIIIFSLIGLAVLGLVIALLMLTDPSASAQEETTTEETTIDENLIISQAEEGEIASISIKNALDDYTIVRTVDKEGKVSWSIEGVDIDPGLYQSSVFETVAGYAEDLTAKEMVEGNAEDLSKYGLDNPTAEVTVTKTDGTETGFILGNSAPAGSYTYIARKGENDVFTNYTYKVNSFCNYSRLNYIITQVIDSYDSSNTPTVQKITVKRKDLEEDIVLEALPELPEDSDSISVFSHQFTSPYNVNLDLSAASDYVYAMYGLTADQAAYLEVTDETKALTGLDDPFCEVSMLVEDTIYRLYIGNPIEEEYTDETSGVTTTAITGYYGYCNKVPDVIYIFSPDTVFWVTMDVEDYISKIFLMPYIYDLTEVSYDDGETSFTVTIEGNSDESHFTLADGTEVDGELFKTMYEYMVQARGEEIYTDEAKGKLLATYTYKYEDAAREDSVVCYYESVDDRSVVVNVDGKNVYKTKSMYVTRLIENAKSFLEGGEVTLTY